MKSALFIAVLVALLVLPAAAFAATASITQQSPVNTTYVIPAIGSQSLNIDITFTTNYTGFSDYTIPNTSISSPLVSCYWVDHAEQSPVIRLMNRTADYHSCVNFTQPFGAGFHRLNLTIKAEELNGTTNIVVNSTFVNFTVAGNSTLYNATSSVVLEDVLLPVWHDTWVSNGESSAQGCNRTFNMTGSGPDGDPTLWTGTNSSTNHGSKNYIVLDAVMIYQYCWSSPAADLTSLWKFNMTNANVTSPVTPNIYQKKLITQLNVNLDALGGCGSPSNHTLYWSPAAGDWDENAITLDNCGAVCTLSQVAKSNRYQFKSQSASLDNIVNSGEANNFFSNPAFMEALYSQDFVTVATNENTQNACNPQLGWSSTHWTYSREQNLSNINMNATLSDYMTSGMDYPGFGCQFGFGCLSPNFYWDFETNSINSQGGQTSFNPQSQPFPQADFKYNVQDNVITPQNGATAVWVAADATMSNTLSEQACASAVGYSAAPLPSPNTNPGEYSVYCFNLSSKHRGYPFFGAIKVLNVDSGGFFNSGDFAFFSAAYGPAFTGFSALDRSPFIVDPGVNVTYTWATSTPLSTGLQYSYYDPVAGRAFGPNTAIYDGNLTTSHSVTIPGLVIQAARTFTVRVFGQDGVGVTHWSTIPSNFTVTGIAGNLTEEQLQSIAFQNFTGSWVAFIREQDTGIYQSGTCTIDSGPCNLPACGPIPEPCIATNTTVPPCGSGQASCSFFCPSGLGSCDYSLQHSCPNKITLDTSPLSQSPQLLFNGILVNAPYIAIHNAATDQFFYAPYYWNYTCTAGGYQTKASSFTIPQGAALPYFISIYLARVPSCTPVLYTISQSNCELNMNQSGVPAWYCQFQTGRCSSYKDGVCVQQGSWVGYDCDSCSVLPTGFACNATAAVGQQPGGTQNIIPSAVDPIAGLFGVSTAVMLAFIAMLISISGSVAVGIKLKSESGLGMSIVFLGLVTAFTIIQWLPFYVWILMVIIGGLLLVKSLRQTFTPQ